MAKKTASRKKSVKRTRRSKTLRKQQGGAVDPLDIYLQGQLKIENQEITAQNAKGFPIVQIPPNHYVIAYDPDAPPGLWLHWISTPDKEIVPYTYPTPPKGSGVHRYIFELRKGEPGPIPPDGNRAIGQAGLDAITAGSELVATSFFSLKAPE